MSRKIDYVVILDAVVKLGLFFISGGIVAYVFDNKIDAITAFIAIITGISFILFGALRPHKKEG
jgi:hypothetical protein